MSKYVTISSVPNTAKLSMAFVFITFCQERVIYFLRCPWGLGFKSGYNGDGRLRPFPAETIHSL